MAASTAVHILRRRLQALSLGAARRQCIREPRPATCTDYAGTPPLLPRRRLLRKTPQTKVHGVFINYVDHGRPHLFARPSSPPPHSPRVDAMLDFLPSDYYRRSWWSVRDHSNGLLLVEMEFARELCVCNPATRWWTLVPWPPANREDCYLGSGFYLAFDPAVSTHFEVFLVPAAREKNVRKVQEDGDDDETEAAHRKMEWPPNPWRLHVFSSRTRRWETRAFVRDGEPAGTVEDMLLDPMTLTVMGPECRCAVYSRWNLYVHCRGDFVARYRKS